jgi:hypothetical protein
LTKHTDPDEKNDHIGRHARRSDDGENGNVDTDVVAPVGERHGGHCRCSNTGASAHFPLVLVVLAVAPGHSGCPYAQQETGIDCISEPANRVIVYSSNMTRNLPESHGVNRSIK